MHSNRIVSAAISLAALVAPTHAYWRMQCPGRLLDARMDPIVDPGKIAGHVHTISGGSAFSVDMTYEDTQTSACSSCSIQQDLSNYWVPSLYYQNQQGQFQSVPQVLDGQGVQGGQVSYYLQRGGPNNDPLVAFPEGFRMLAGNPYKRNLTTDFAGQAVSFVCMNYSGNSEYYNQLPDVPCPDGVRAQIFFPSCWDGVNLDSLDHTSHVSYPESVAYNNGPCPSDYPVHLVSLFYEVIFQTNNFDWWVPNNTWQPFVFAMGDPTGYGFHGDFLNGWNVTVLQEAVDQCTNDTGGGDIFACPPFEFFSTEESQACILASPIDEVVSGTLDALPGCNPVQYSNAVPQSGCANSANVTFGTSALESFYKNVTGWTYLGCGYDNGTTRTFSAAEWWSSSVTVESCMDYCGSQGYKYVGLEYGDQCFCGNTLPADRAPVPGILGNCLSPCAGDSSEICGGAAMLSIYELTGSFQMIYNSGVSVVNQVCPVLNGQNYTVSGNTYQFKCGQDFSGSNLKTINIANPGNMSQCANACAANPPCTFASLSGSTCYLKSGTQNPIVNSAVNALFLVNGTTVTTSSTTTVAEVPGATYTAAPSCPGSNQTYYSSGGALFLIECGIDHSAGNLNMVYVSNLTQCIQTCATTAGCVDVSLSGAACYMKSSVGAALQAPGILGARLISGGSSATTTSTRKTSSKTTTSSSSSTTKSSVTTTTSTLSTASRSSSSTTSTGSASPVVNAASVSTSSSSTTLSTSTTSTGEVAGATYTAAPSCPSSNSTYYLSPSTGDVFLIECGIDHYAGNLASQVVSSFQQCIELCASTSGCVDVSLSSGTCYMKSSVGAASAVSYVKGARLITKGTNAPSAATASSTSSSSAATSSSSSVSGTLTTSSTTSSTSSGATATVTAATCPQNNGSIYVDPTTGYSFQLQCGVDHAGGDLSMTYVNSLGDCIAACATTAGCVDVSLSGAACYMKQSVGTALQNSGILGALLVNNTPSSSATGTVTANNGATVGPPVAAMTKSS